MSLVRWDPFRNMVTLQDRINRLFEDAFPGPAEGGEDLAAGAWRPLVDIFDAESGVVIKIDLPGVSKEDVSVEVKDNILYIQGERKADSSVPDDRFYRRERVCGTFQRSFAMQAAIAPDRIKASFKNGVLTIEVPKPETEQPRQVSVNID